MFDDPVNSAPHVVVASTLTGLELLTALLFFVAVPLFLAVLSAVRWSRWLK